MKWWVWVIIAIVAIVVLGIALFAVNRAFRRKYGFSLYGGGFLLLIGIASLVCGLALLSNGSMIGYALFVITAITFLFTIIYDFKKCGIAGIITFLLQLIFCVPSLLIIFDIIFNRGRSTMEASMAEYRYDRRLERRRRRKGYKDNDYRY